MFRRPNPATPSERFRKLVLINLARHLKSGVRGAAKSEPETNVSLAELPRDIPECDLPPLPGRAGPFVYKGYPYYVYLNGDVDGFKLNCNCPIGLISELN
jgi:hypothetical protein